MRDFKAEKKKAVRRLRRQVRRLIAAGLTTRVSQLRRIKAQLEQEEGAI